MQLPRVFAIGLWLVATVASTVVVWTATSIVAADVTDRPAAVLAHQDVVRELEPDSSVAGATPTSTTAPATAPTSAPADGRGPAAGSPSPQGPAGPPSPTAPPDVPVPSLSPPTTATPVPGAGSVRPPAGPAASQPSPRPTATYSTSGGVVRVACNGFFIDLISAIPSNGYAVRVVAGGPANVDVRFVRSGQELSVKAVCFGEQIRYYEEDRPPRQPGRS